MRRYLLMLLLGAVVFGSCSKDNLFVGSDDSTKESYMTLRIKTPGGFSSSAKSRGMTTTEENNIDNVWVLVFNDANKLVDIQKGTNITTEGATNAHSFSVKLKPSFNDSQKFTLMVLANSEQILNTTIGTDVGAITNNGYYDIIAALSDHITGAMYPTGGVIPMWGEVADVIVPKNGGGSLYLSLMRAIARVDVGVGTPTFDPEQGKYVWGGTDAKGDKIPFEISEVYVIRPNNGYAVVPDPANVDASKKATAVTIPTGTTPFSFEDSRRLFAFSGEGIITPSGDNGLGSEWGSYTTQSIYLPESNVMMEGTTSGDTNHEQRMAVVVGGSYNGGTTTYYRIDFVKNKLLIDVLRNHLYQFNIRKVSGEGYPDVETAYKSMATNMNVDILEWNEADMSDIAFDGQYYFSITSREVEFTPMGGERQTLRIKTNVADFEMFDTATSTVELKAGSKPKYSQTEMGYDYELKNLNGDIYELIIDSKFSNVSNDAPNRRQEWKLRAGRLSVPLVVDQLFTHLYISYVNGANAALYPEGTIGGVEIPIEIMALNPVAIATSGDGGGSWIDLGDYSGLSTPVRGIYQARLKVKVPIYSGGTTNRKGMITVTPQGESAREFTITQEAPFITLSSNEENIPRTAPSYLNIVDVKTNIPLSALTLSRSASEGDGNERIQLDGGLYNIDRTNPRYMRFNIKADMTPQIPVNAFSANFTVATKAEYGAVAPATVRFAVADYVAIFERYWRTASISANNSFTFPTDDASAVYVFPWQSTDVKFEFVSNIGASFDSANSGNKKGKGTLTPGEQYENASLVPVYPYTFNFNNDSYNTRAEYKLYFKNDPAQNGGKTVTKYVSMFQYYQLWSRSTLANSGNVGYAGITEASKTSIEITGNVEWSTIIDSWTPATPTDWITLRATTSGAFTTPTTADPLRVDNRVTKPYKMMETGDADAEKAALTQKTPLQLVVAPYSTLNATPNRRSAVINFANKSLDGTKGGAAISAPTLTLTQYAPMLEFVSSTLPATGTQIPGGGATYTVTSSTNLQGWGVKVYEGTDNTGTLLATQPFDETTKINAHSPAENYSMDMKIPTGSPGSTRNVAVYIYCTEFNTKPNEKKFAQATQAASESIPTGIIYIGSDGVLKVCHETDSDYNRDRLMFFKFGSVVGFTNNNDAWANSHVKFNPVTPGGGYTYANIPVFARGNAPVDTEGAISASGYHNYANVRAGKGDPCKLVGKTAAEINAMTKAEFDSYNSGWRLPTSLEQADFCGLSGAGTSSYNNSTFPYYANSSGNATTSSGTATAPARGYFPIGGGTQATQTTGRTFNSSGSWLPAAGLRYATGATSNVGSNGRYWLGTVNSTTFGYFLFFNSSSVSPRSYTNYAYGFSVRCVRQ